MRLTKRTFLASLLVCGACGGGAADRPDGSLSIAICDTGAGPFSLTIDNPFFPLPVGHRLVFEGMEGGTALDLEIEVLDMTEVVGGVTTRVVRETEHEDDELVEISHNYFAQAPDGTVCYFGEAVDIYEAGQIVAHDGAWRAEGGNRAGIIMPAMQVIGASYAQEVAPGVAEDMAQIVALGESLTVPAGTYTDTLRTLEWTPLEPGHEDSKFYIRGIGLAVDAGNRLVSSQ
jgi:hypothetical protein